MELFLAHTRISYLGWEEINANYQIGNLFFVKGEFNTNRFEDRLERNGAPERSLAVVNWLK